MTDRDETRGRAETRGSRYRICPTTRKLGFASKGDAKRAARQTQSGGSRLETYRCEDCRDWHNGHSAAESEGTRKTSGYDGRLALLARLEAAGHDSPIGALTAARREASRLLVAGSAEAARSDAIVLAAREERRGNPREAEFWAVVRDLVEAGR